MVDETGKNSVEEPEVTVPEIISEEVNEAGTIRISENVIAAVVRKYTLEVDGVIGFAAGGFGGALADMIHKRRYESSVMVNLEGDAVNIAVTLVLQFGVRIPDVAANVQDVVRSQVKELTGKNVTKVDVIVQDLQEEAAPEPDITETINE